MADEKAVEHFRQALAQGLPWYPALLEAIGLWTLAEETVDGQHYRYLIDGEAFDWLLLARRLGGEVGGLIPQEELSRLLEQSQPPQELSRAEFKRLIGAGKYKAYLNYYYGVTVEEALQGAVEEEVKKRRRCIGLPEEVGVEEEAFLWLYGAPQSRLLNQFLKDKGYPRRLRLSLSQFKEFTYWLFKYRVKHCDKARVASDTKKALRYLEAQKGLDLPPKGVCYNSGRTLISGDTNYGVRS